MSRKPLIFGAGGLLLGIAAGHWLWTSPAPPGAPVPTEASARAKEVADLQAELAELREAYARLEQRSPRRAAVVDEDGDPNARPPAPAAAIAEPRGEALAVAFGRWRDEPALRLADWVDMGRRADDLVRSRRAGIGGGRPTELAALEKKALREMRRHLGRIHDRQPELDGHPIVVVNLMASHLQQAGLPLQPDQIDAITAEGRRYEAAAARLPGDDVLASERKLRSIQLRKEHVDRIVDDVLTREQWNVLFDPATKGLLYYDVYQVGGPELERPNSSVYWRHDRADAEEHLRLFLLTEWEIPRTELPSLEPIVGEWIDAILALPKHTSHPSSALHIDEVLPCAEVHVRFQKRIIALLGHDAALARRIHDNPIHVIFPQLRDAR